jgi:hypothetical protein
MNKIQTIKRLILPKHAVQVRTSTDRTGCTNFFRKKMHFLRTGVDKRLDAYKTPHPAATGPVDVMCCTRVPQSGNSGVFCFLPEYTGNFAERAKKRQNCNGKRKKPLLVAGLQQQGRRGNRILNKTAERIIMRKKLKKEGRPHGTRVSACTIQCPSCGLDERAQYQPTGACQGGSAAPKAPSTVLSVAQKEP